MDGRYTRWEVIQEEKCYRNDITKIINKKDINVCDQTLNTRIGSESAAGFVYKIQLEKIDVALKIMPIISEDSERSNKKEISYMQQTGSLVKEGESPYFLYFITADKCYNFKYPKEKSSKEKFAKEYLGVGKLKVDYYVAELAKMDLGQWIEHYYNPEDMYNYLQHILKGILALQGEIILHADLHPGNIVIVERGKECQTLCCITDFGGSMSIENNDDYYIDYITIINHLFSKLKDKKDKISRMLLNMKKDAFRDFNNMQNKEEFLEYVISEYF